jgi:hypothetical protein
VTLTRKFYKETLMLEPWAGAVVSEAVREACIVSLTENRAVELPFNGIKIRIEPAEVLRPLLAQYNPGGPDAEKA